MLALFANLHLFEISVVLIVAIMIFGRRLPEVAARAAAQVGKLRRQMETLWRETGIEREFREVQAEVRKAQAAVPRDLKGSDYAQIASNVFEQHSDDEEAQDDPDSDAGAEPEGEARRGLGAAAGARNGEVERSLEDLARDDEAAGAPEEEQPEGAEERS